MPFHKINMIISGNLYYFKVQYLSPHYYIIAGNLANILKINADCYMFSSI